VKLVDLNVLLYAINRDAPQHEAALGWWESALNGDESIGLPWVVLIGFLRLATNPRVFQAPLASDTALGMVGEWLALEIVCLPTEKPEHWETLNDLLSTAGTAGNLATDAHLAALALNHDAVLVSSDRDFARFKGLRLEDPVSQGFHPC